MPGGPSIEFATAASSDPGRDPNKQVNEDAFRLVTRGDGLLAVVCDGMGGHVGGRLASNAAASCIERGFREAPFIADPRRLLGSLMGQAAQEVYSLGGHVSAEERPGSTCVAAWLSQEGLYVAHVGDSRAYRLRHGQLYPLTVDHTVVQAWIAAGQLSPEQAKGHPDAHRITRALGVTPNVEVEVRPSEDLRVGDRLLLCTDGLTDMLDDREIAQLLDAREPLGVLAPRMVALANQRGGHDNITVVLVEVTALGSSPYLTAATPARTATGTDAVAGGTVPDGSAPLQKTVLLEAEERTTILMGAAATPSPSGTSRVPPGGALTKTVELPASPAVPTNAPQLSPRPASRPLLVHSPQQQVPKRMWFIVAAVLVLTLFGLLLRLLRHRGS